MLLFLKLIIQLLSLAVGMFVKWCSPSQNGLVKLATKVSYTNNFSTRSVHAFSLNIWSWTMSQNKIRTCLPQLGTHKVAWTDWQVWGFYFERSVRFFISTDGRLESYGILSKTYWSEKHLISSPNDSIEIKSRVIRKKYPIWGCLLKFCCRLILKARSSAYLW